MLCLEHGSVWCWNLDAPGNRSEMPGKFWNVVLEKDGEDQLDHHVRNSYIILFLGILFSSILCTCLNQRNLFNLIVSVRVSFLTTALVSLLVNILQFSFSLPYTEPKILRYTFLSKILAFYLSLLVSRFLMHMLKFCLLLCSLVLILVL